jgi:hypothetical protein
MGRLFDIERVEKVRKAINSGRPLPGNKESQPLAEPIAQSPSGDSNPGAPAFMHGWRAGKAGEHPGLFTLRPGVALPPEVVAFVTGRNVQPAKPDPAPDSPEFTSKPWTRIFCSLYNAMRARDLDAMQKAIDNGANVNSRVAYNLASSDRDEDKNLVLRTPLGMALEWGFDDVARLLRKNGAKE